MLMVCNIFGYVTDWLEVIWVTVIESGYSRISFGEEEEQQGILKAKFELQDWSAIFMITHSKKIYNYACDT